jgi:hypothetical protein
VGLGSARCCHLRASESTTCSLILGACRQLGDAPAALDAWERMRADELWPTTAGLQHLLVVCGAGGEWRRARAILQLAGAPREDGGGGLHTDVRQWNAVLAGSVRSGELRAAEALLSEMAAGAGSGGLHAPDATSFNTVLHGYVPRWAGGEGHGARAERAEALLARMDGAGLARTEATFNALIDLHQYDPARVSRLLTEAMATGVVLQVRTFAKVARTLWWARLAEPARELMRTMERAGLQPDASFFAVCITAAQSVGLLDEADRLHREALDKGLEQQLGATLAASQAKRRAAPAKQ